MSPSTAHNTSGVRANIIECGQRIMASKGFSGVGLNEILAGAAVPKGSFYHYFGSKEAFGEAMLTAYFEDYLTNLDAILREPDLTVAQRLMTYFQHWQDTQSVFECQGKCLAVKLGAEAADLSEAMRTALKRHRERSRGRVPVDCRGGGQRRAEPLPTLAWCQRDGEDRSQHPAFRVSRDDDSPDPSSVPVRRDSLGCISLEVPTVPKI